VLVISIGCPAGIGPEVSVAAAARVRGAQCVLVGDEATILAAADLVGVPRSRFELFVPGGRASKKLAIHPVGPALNRRDRAPGRPTRRAGGAQLAWIDAAYDLVRAAPGRALVTGPVSKAAIASSGARGAGAFLGHTEWLCARDGAKTSIMCFASDELVTSLASTHLPLARVPRFLTPERVRDATLGLVELLGGLGRKRPHVAVCSLNPHAGESELLGDEERRAIVPGILAARRRSSRRARIEGPIGAETAYRKARAGGFDGVVAMYHDQATIPLKLVAFGAAVNVTVGLSIVRTSVDHGTGYDIAWRGVADASGMSNALKLAQRLLAAKIRARVA
jgi:4-phospho-D-threonate 3-dehydrogenase / 4-phospho-D-erythronate 3-dehydrogenase